MEWIFADQFKAWAENENEAESLAFIFFFLTTPCTMDVSSLIAASSSKSRSIEVVKEVPLQVDAGLLAVFDSNELDEEAYRSVEAVRMA